MPEPEKQELVVEEPEVQVSKPGVTVDLSPKQESTQKKAGESDESHLRRLQALENLLAGSRRISEDSRREVRELRQLIEGLSQKISVPSKEEPAPVNGAKDELDVLVEQGRWKEAVSKLAEQKANQLIKERDAQFEFRKIAENRNMILENSKRQVYEDYPQLHPETGNEEDPFSQVYIQTVNAHPEWHQNEYGPLLALREAEKTAKAQGISLSSKPAIQPNQEVVRRGRANVTSLPPGRTGVTENRITLTLDEKAMCDRMNIPYETFARNKRALEQGGSVEA